MWGADIPRATSKSTRRVLLLIGLALVGLALLYNPFTASAVHEWLSGPRASPARYLRPNPTGLVLFVDGFLLATGLGLALFPFRKARYVRPLYALVASVALTFVLIVMAEGLFFALVRLEERTAAPPAIAPYRYVYRTPDGARTNLIQLDSTLGYVPVPGMHVQASRLGLADEVLYTAAYTIDSLGRRVTPVSPGGSREKFILFFVDSFVFGDGVNDDETLPAQVGALAPGYRPYNYGVSGHGAQHLLARFEGATLPTQVEERTGLAIYLFLDQHVSRTVGTMVIHNQYGSLMPYYMLDKEGEPVRKGTFTSGRPVLDLLYPLLGSSNTLRYLGYRDLPGITDADLALMARIILEAQRTFEQQFTSEGFYVLLYPSADTERLIPYLDASGIAYLDYSGLFDPQADALHLPGDSHPSPDAYRRIAERLVADLAIDQP